MVSPGLYKYSRVRTLAGTHSLSVKLVEGSEEVHVFNSPFQFVVKPGEIDVANTQTNLPSLQAELESSEPQDLVFEIDPKDSYGNLILDREVKGFEVMRRVVTEGPESAWQPASPINAKKQGNSYVYGAQEEFSKGNDVTLEIALLYRGEHLPGSPKVFKIAPKEDYTGWIVGGVTVLIILIVAFHYYTKWRMKNLEEKLKSQDSTQIQRQHSTRAQLDEKLKRVHQWDSFVNGATGAMEVSDLLSDWYVGIKDFVPLLGDPDFRMVSIFYLVFLVASTGMSFLLVGMKYSHFRARQIESKEGIRRNNESLKGRRSPIMMRQGNTAQFNILRLHRKISVAWMKIYLALVEDLPFLIFNTMLFQRSDSNTESLLMIVKSSILFGSKITSWNDIKVRLELGRNYVQKFELS